MAIIIFFVDNMIMGPLKGRGFIYPKKYSNEKKVVSNKSSLLSQTEKETENEFSQSDDDVFEIDKKASRHYQKRKSSKQRNRSCIKPTEYIFLDDEPTAHMSYV